MKGLELQLEERLAEEAVGIGDGAADPERRPDAVDCGSSSEGKTTVYVRSCAEPSRFESGSISGSSWPVQLDVYQTYSCECFAMQDDCDVVDALAGPADPAISAATASAVKTPSRLPG